MRISVHGDRVGSQESNLEIKEGKQHPALIEPQICIKHPNEHWLVNYWKIEGILIKERLSDQNTKSERKGPQRIGEQAGGKCSSV